MMKILAFKTLDDVDDDDDDDNDDGGDDDNYDVILC